MTSQVEVPPLTGLIHFFSGKRKVNTDFIFVLQGNQIRRVLKKKKKKNKKE